MIMMFDFLDLFFREVRIVFWIGIQTEINPNSIISFIQLNWWFININPNRILTDRSWWPGCNQHCTTNRKWTPFDWTACRWCRGKRRLDVLHGHRGKRDRPDNRFRHSRTCLGSPEHRHSGNSLGALHGRWGNRGRARQGFCSDFGFFSFHGVRRLGILARSRRSESGGCSILFCGIFFHSIYFAFI